MHGSAMVLTLLLLAAAEKDYDVKTAPEKTLTLGTALTTALDRNPTLRRASFEVGGGQARVARARSSAYPLIDFGTSVTNGPTGSPALGLRGLAGTPLKKHYGGSLNITQVLFDSGRTRSNVTQARSLLEASRYHVEAQRAWVVLTTSEAFYRVLLSQRLVEVADQTVRQRAVTLDQARAHLEAGLKSRVDVRLSEFELSKAQAASAEARNDLETDRAELAQAIGLPDLSGFDRVDDLSPLPSPPGALDELLASGMANRPELEESDARIDSNQAGIRAARSENRFNVVGVSSFGRVHPSDFLRNSRQRALYSFGVAITLPIFTGGRIQADIREAFQELEGSRAAREEVEQAVRLQITRAYHAAQTHRKNYFAAEDQVAAADDALRLATVRYQNNLSDIVELTQSQVVHTEALTAQATSFYEYKVAQVSLDYATGKLQTTPSGGGRRPPLGYLDLPVPR